MSNRRLPSVRKPRGRAVAAAQLAEHMLGDTEPARDWSAAPELPELPSKPRKARKPRPADVAREWSVDELVEVYGSVTALARLSGLSRSTVSAWHSGRRDPGHARRRTRERLAMTVEDTNRRVYEQTLVERELAHRDALARWRSSSADVFRERSAVMHRELVPVIEAFGGVDALAAASGITPRQVQRWLAGETAPSVESWARMQRADARRRVSEAHGIEFTTEADAEEYGTDPGHPKMQVFMRASGDVHCVGGEGSPTYDYHRNMGIEDYGPDGMHALPDDVVAHVIDAVGMGDYEGALDVLQEHMSTGYARCAGYDPAQGLGYFMDTLDELYLSHTGMHPVNITNIA